MTRSTTSRPTSSIGSSDNNVSHRSDRPFADVDWPWATVEGLATDAAALACDVACVLGDWHLGHDDPAGALREFRRVLRPLGRLVVLEFDRPRSRLLASLARGVERGRVGDREARWQTAVEMIAASTAISIGPATQGLSRVRVRSM